MTLSGSATAGTVVGNGAMALLNSTGALAEGGKAISSNYVRLSLISHPAGRPWKQVYFPMQKVDK